MVKGWEKHLNLCMGSTTPTSDHLISQTAGPIKGALVILMSSWIRIKKQKSAASETVLYFHVSEPTMHLLNQDVAEKLSNIHHKPAVFSENCSLGESVPFLRANEDLAGNGTALRKRNSEASTVNQHLQFSQIQKLSIYLWQHPVTKPSKTCREDFATDYHRSRGAYSIRVFLLW